jgi:hypothetical protein
MTAQAALKQPGATIRASKHSEPATQEKLIQADKSEPTGIRMTCEWGQDAAWAPGDLSGSSCGDGGHIRQRPGRPRHRLVQAIRCTAEQGSGSR